MVTVVLVSACASSDSGSTPLDAGSLSTTTLELKEPAPSSPDDLLRLVVVGDSIPFASFCAGCDVFVDQYAVSLEMETGRAVEALNRSRNDAAGLRKINEQLVGEELLREQLATASAVIVSVGFNDQAPWPNDRPCQNDGGVALATKVDAILEYSDSCIEDTIESYRPAYESAFEEISTLVAEPRVLLALNVYNIVPGFPELEAIATQNDLDSLNMVTKKILDGWNEMLCETATSHGFTCVDIYRAFNGADGTIPAGSKLESDYTHPSQAGNDLIADLLREVDVSKLAAGN